MSFFSSVSAYMTLMFLFFADIFAVVAMSLTMTYLTDVWKIGFTSATAIMNMWIGSILVLPLVFAHIADAFIGNFSVLLVSTLSSCAGLGLVALSTPPMLGKHYGTCSDYEPECVGDQQKRLFYAALALIAVGLAGHISSLFSVAAEQIIAAVDENEFDNHNNDDDIGAGVMLAGCCGCCGTTTIFVLLFAGVVAIPFIHPWAVKYGLASIYSLLVTLVFLCGICTYRYVGPQGSPLTIVLRVILASISKLFYRHPPSTEVNHKLYGYNEDESPKNRTRGFRCLEKAAIILPNQPLEKQKQNRWRLCTVNEVEATKTFLRMIPISLTFILVGVVSSFAFTYFQEQANHMSRKVGKLTLPLSLFMYIFYEGSLGVFVSLYFKVARMLFGNDDQQGRCWRFAAPVGIGTSMVFSILCCITAAKVEARRLNVLETHGLLLDNPDDGDQITVPMTIFWLAPQFILMGAVHGIFFCSVILFFVDQVSDLMLRYVAFFLCSVFGGGIMGNSLMVFLVGKITHRSGGDDWFQHTLNRSRLDKYYWLLSWLSAVNLGFFIVLACLYAYKNARTGTDNDEDGGDDEEENECEIDIEWCLCCCSKS